MRLTEMFSRFYNGERRSSKKFDKNRKHQQGQSAIAKEMNNRVIHSNSKQMHEADAKRGAGNASERATIGFGFTSDWMTKWREILNQSCNVVV